MLWREPSTPAKYLVRYSFYQNLHALHNLKLHPSEQIPRSLLVCFSSFSFSKSNKDLGVGHFLWINDWLGLMARMFLGPSTLLRRSLIPRKCSVPQSLLLNFGANKLLWQTACCMLSLKHNQHRFTSFYQLFTEWAIFCSRRKSQIFWLFYEICWLPSWSFDRLDYFCMNYSVCHLCCHCY